MVDGIPVTSVPRTIFDLATVLPARQLERALNEMEVRGLTDRLSVPDLLQRYPRRRGTATVRRLLEGRTGSAGVTRSELEERFIALLDAHGLPRPRTNVDIAIQGRFIQPDFLWAKQRLIVELDGRAAHAPPGPSSGTASATACSLADGWRVMPSAHGVTFVDAPKHGCRGRADVVLPARRRRSLPFRRAASCLSITCRDESRQGPVADGAFTGAAGGAACGDLARISLVRRRGTIRAVTFEPEGCGATRAATAAVAEMVDGADRPRCGADRHR